MHGGILLVSALCHLAAMVQVKLRSGPHEGETVRAEYEDICKMQGR